MSERFDPRSLSMNLWHALIGRGVDEGEATTLMNGYAHELAERQRVEARSPGLVLRVSRPEDPRAVAMALADHLTDLIDPHVRPASDEEQTP